MDLKEAMAKALEMEKTGREFYLSVAEKSENPMVKEVFAYAAAQEKFHEDEIQKFIDSSEVELGGDKSVDIKKFFGHEIESFTEHMTAAAEDVEAYEKAMELEKTAFNFYKEEHDTTDDDEVKQFMVFLMDQENGHYELFRNGLEYLQNPDSYHMGGEDWSFEG